MSVCLSNLVHKQLSVLVDVDAIVLTVVNLKKHTHLKISVSSKLKLLKHQMVNLRLEHFIK